MRCIQGRTKTRPDQGPLSCWDVAKFVASSHPARPVFQATSPLLTMEVLYQLS